MSPQDRARMGGLALKAKRTPEERSQRARELANARWGNLTDAERVIERAKGRKRRAAGTGKSA